MDGVCESKPVLQTLECNARVAGGLQRARRMREGYEGAPVG